MLRADFSNGEFRGRRSAYLGVFDGNWALPDTAEVFASSVNEFSPADYRRHHALLRRVAVGVADDFESRSMGCLDSGRL